MKRPNLIVLLACPLLLVGSVSTGWADDAEFDETRVIIEINGTDGDVGSQEARYPSRVSSSGENKLQEQKLGLAVAPCKSGAPQGGIHIQHVLF